MPDSDGKAYIAGWIIKLLAGALLMTAIGWAGTISTNDSKQDVKIGKVEVKVDNMTKQLDRIENKIDRLKR